MMLGAGGPKQYFLAFQNEAEARGTDGLAGAFAIVQANHGKLAFTRMESDTTLEGVAATVNFGPDYDHLFGSAGTTTTYSQGNLSPHFPYAAQIWASKWKKYSGQQVDGVIAIDPTALGYLLAVTGPATLPDKTQISGANTVALTQATTYAKFGGQIPRTDPHSCREPPKKHPTTTPNPLPSSQESRLTPRARFNRKLSAILPNDRDDVT